MGTRKLYYEDTERFECEAAVIARTELAGRPAVVLDATVFYPEGGGQPCDLGTIDGIPVVDVQEKDGVVLHALASPLPERGGPVPCRVDPDRRRDHMEQHTGQHLLSSRVLKLAGGATVSFHLGQEYSTVDVDLPELSRETADRIEDEIARIIREGHPVTIHVCPPENVSDFPLRRPPPAGEEALRIVDLDGLDYSACCGTHLSNTGRIGALRILKTEKYKGMTRIYFAAGERARRDARRTAALAREAARLLGCSEDEAPDRVARSLERIKDLELRLASARAERADAEARIFLAGTPAAGTPAADAPASGLLVLPLSDRTYEEVLEAAKAVTGISGRPSSAASRPDLRAVVTAPDASARLGERLKPLLAGLGGKGGGGPAQFQAQFPDEPSLTAFLDAARGILAG